MAFHIAAPLPLEWSDFELEMASRVRALLLLDENLAGQGYTHYAVAIATKP